LTTLYNYLFFNELVDFLAKLPATRAGACLVSVRAGGLGFRVGASSLTGAVSLGPLKLGPK
jgi:hypothetical protein